MNPLREVERHMTTLTLYFTKCYLSEIREKSRVVAVTKPRVENAAREKNA